MHNEIHRVINKVIHIMFITWAGMRGGIVYKLWFECCCIAMGGFLYTNHGCILVKGAKPGISLKSHFFCGGQGAKTKVNPD